MSLPHDDEPRRPPPSTGRQDRHRGTEPEPPGAPNAAAAKLPPRGAAYYSKGRAHQVGLGCLVVLFIGAAAAALLLLVVGLSPSDDDFVPAAGSPGRSTITENPAGGAGG